MKSKSEKITQSALNNDDGGGGEDDNNGLLN